MREFSYSTAVKHVQEVNRIKSEYPDHSVMVIGDFNLHHIKWTNDGTDSYFVPIDIADRTSMYFSEVSKFLGMMLDGAFYQLLSNIYKKLLQVR